MTRDGCNPGTCYCACEYQRWWVFKCRAGRHCGKHNRGCHMNCR